MTTRAVTTRLLKVWGFDGPSRRMGSGVAYRLHTRNAATVSSELFIYRLFISRRVVNLFSRELVSFADLFWFDAMRE